VLERRYGHGLADRRRAMFDEAGLPHAEPLEKVPNSRGALMLAELARERGAFDEVHARLFAAYWAEGRDLGDQAVLLQEGRAAGLDEGEIIDALSSGRYLERIEAQTHQAIELGAGGVPAWLIDQRVLVPGAQPHEIFERVLERLGHSPLDGEGSP
jgi:predicted DsbA family dithiol-disulfide isomerase